MAIQVTYTKAGVVATDAYLRLVSITGNKTSGWFGTVRVYATAQERLWFDEFTVEAEYVENETPYVTLYRAAKPRFAGARDV